MRACRLLRTPFFFTMLIPVHLRRVLIRETDQTFLVELAEQDGPRMLPIVIGMPEAQAIMRRLSGEQAPRPMTHDLLDSAVCGLGGEVVGIAIISAKKGVFYARVLIRQGSRELDLDARPSDALALAADADVPISVEESLLVDG